MSISDPKREITRINVMVHRVLALGLAVSAILMIAGLLVGLARHGSMPRATLSLHDALREGLAGREEGLLSLGLFALILTPFLRVGGSVVMFVRQRDWRFVAITLVVLAIMITSLWAGSI